MSKGKTNLNCSPLLPNTSTRVTPLIPPTTLFINPSILCTSTPQNILSLVPAARRGDPSSQHVSTHRRASPPGRPAPPGGGRAWRGRAGGCCGRGRVSGGGRAIAEPTALHLAATHPANEVLRLYKPTNHKAHFPITSLQGQGSNKQIRDLLLNVACLHQILEKKTWQHRNYMQIRMVNINTCLCSSPCPCLCHCPCSCLCPCRDAWTDSSAQPPPSPSSPAAPLAGSSSTKSNNIPTQQHSQS